jgi:DNA-binding cell septation regulator SpoVG
MLQDGVDDQDNGLDMQITEVKVRPTNDGLVRAYANIVFDNCLMIRDIRVIESPHGTLHLNACQEADRRHPLADCLSGQC